MRFSLLLLTLLAYGWAWGQFQFNGQVAKDFRNKEVHLSLVEDYRKTSRIYLDQIFQKTTADSLGHFSFVGDNIPVSNRIYRIYVDACDGSGVDKNHFLSACNQMESILFIANNTDTLSLPIGNDQRAFCKISSTNTVSDALLRLDQLKEGLIVDVLEQPSQVAKNQTFKKWIQHFQHTCLSLNEPLAELYVFAFLSNRENETYPHYLKDLREGHYYEGLAARLIETYHRAPFVQQFKKELHADRTLITEEQIVQSGFGWGHVPYILLVISLFLCTFYAVEKWKGANAQNPFDILSPQEGKIFKAILGGKSNKEIAADFFISLSTVKSHINSLYKKLGMSSRSEILSHYKGKR